MIFIDRKLWQVASEMPIGNVAVGGIIQLRENLVPVDYIVVHQGLPSSMYDASCNGTWLLRKDIAENRQWNSTNVNDYENSTIDNYLNTTFLNLFDADIREVIKQVKIPYQNGTGSGGSVASGENGLSCKIFLLSGYEVGFTNNMSPYFPNDGAKLDYFVSGNSSSANQKRVAKLNGSATDWWLRSPNSNSIISVWSVDFGGDYNYWRADNSSGVRPALILPSDFLI